MQTQVKGQIVYQGLEELGDRVSVLTVNKWI